MTNHAPDMSRVAAEQLLTGQHGRTRLHRALAAASAPGSARELAAESKAVAQFRAVQLHPIHPARRRSVLKTAAAKLLAAKVVVGVAAAAAATSGVAVAAATNHATGPVNNNARPAVAASGTHTTGGAPSAEPSRPSPLPTPASLGRPSSAHPSRSTSHAAQGSPSPSLVGLCTAYQAGVSNNPGRALDNPAFTALITAAGGKDHVLAYCMAILTTAHPSATANHSASPPSHPTEPPSAHPSAPTHPTGPPSTPPEHH
jgi:hypothetical protein